MTVALIRPNTLYAWKGPSLLIVNTHGQCGEDAPLTGCYFREARFRRTGPIALMPGVTKNRSDPVPGPARIR